MQVALINTNRIKPLIAPIGLDYVAEAVNAAGHTVAVLDLCWSDVWERALSGFLERTRFDLVGVKLRNTDDCAFTSRQSFLTFCEGGQAGIETKRGCTCQCIYCADPIAKGREIRTRPPNAVVDEMERLLEQGIDYMHICDSEFNLPEWHASEVCKEINRRNLGDKIHWYAYCSPVPFSRGLAEQMHRAGCAGINFGVDNGDEAMLRRLRRDFTPVDILNAVQMCKEAGIVVMLDLLLGSPGETRASIIRTIELMRRAEPDRVGITLGVRVYPGTELAHSVMRKNNGLVGGGDLLEPLFFIEPVITPFAFELLDELVGDDRRFFFFDPARSDRNYHYNANQLLVDAIQKGYRGAYWDILRKL